MQLGVLHVQVQQTRRLGFVREPHHSGLDLARRQVLDLEPARVALAGDVVPRLPPPSDGAVGTLVETPGTDDRAIDGEGPQAEVAVDGHDDLGRGGCHAWRHLELDRLPPGGRVVVRQPHQRPRDVDEEHLLAVLAERGGEQCHRPGRRADLHRRGHDRVVGQARHDRRARRDHVLLDPGIALRWDSTGNGPTGERSSARGHRDGHADLRTDAVRSAGLPRAAVGDVADVGPAMRMPRP